MSRRPQPSPGPGEVLIKAEAIGVNFIDTYFRSGTYPRDLPFVLGTEVAGTVAAVGDGVTGLSVGDRVVTAAASGAYAEFSTAPAQFVAQVPSDSRPGRGRVSTAEGYDGALPDQVGVPGAVRRHGAGARRSRWCRADLDAVGGESGRSGDHDGVDAGEGRAVAAGRRHRCAGLPGRRCRPSSAGVSAT